jgi:hypothetical protein
MIDVARELLENPDDDGKAKHLYENIDVAGQQENLDNEHDIEPLDTTVWPEEDPQPKNIKSDGMFFKPIVVDEDEIMLEMARSLSFEQRIVFDKLIRFCKMILRSSKGAHIPIIPPNLIVTGNAHILKMFFL